MNYWNINVNAIFEHERTMTGGHNLNGISYIDIINVCIKNYKAMLHAN